VLHQLKQGGKKKRDLNIDKTSKRTNRFCSDLFLFWKRVKK